MIKSSDDDSDNYSANTVDSKLGLVLRKHEDDSSSDDNNKHNTDSESDEEPKEWRAQSDQSMNFRTSPLPTIQISSRDFGNSDSDESSLYSENEDDVPELAHRYNTPEITTQIDHKPLRLQGGYDLEENIDSTLKPGTIRVETAKNSLTNKETSQQVIYNGDSHRQYSIVQSIG